MNRIPTFLVSFALALPLLGAEPPREATVDAGKFARRATFVPLTVPDTVDANSRWELRDANSNMIMPLQVLPGGGRAVTIAPPLNKGEARPLALVRVKAPALKDVVARRDG